MHDNIWVKRLIIRDVKCQVNDDYKQSVMIILSNDSNQMESRIFPKHLIISSFIFSILSWQVAIALIIVICSFDFIGFNNSTPITATCTQTYFTNKFSAVSLQIEVSLIGSVIACVVLTPIMAVTIGWIIRVCKDQTTYKQGTKNLILIILMLSCMATISQIPICGYYLTFVVELNSCNSTYNKTHIYATATLSVLLILSTLILWILLMISYFKAQKIQPEVQEYYTTGSPKIRVKVQINKNSLFTYKESQNKNKNNLRNLEITDENLYHSPINNINSEGSQYITDNNFNNLQRSKKAIGQSHKGQIRNTDGKDFHKQMNNYMNKYQSGAILPSYGIQQKNHNLNKEFNGIFKPERENKRQLNEKHIINNIRGKYGDY